MKLSRIEIDGQAQELCVCVCVCVCMCVCACACVCVCVRVCISVTSNNLLRNFVVKFRHNHTWVCYCIGHTYMIWYTLSLLAYKWLTVKALTLYSCMMNM